MGAQQRFKRHSGLQAFARVALSVLLVSVAGFSCGSPPGAKTPAELIAEDPLVLLPPAPVGYVRVDGASVFASPLAAPLTRAIQQRVPVPQSMGWVPGRDLRELHLGVYSLQGVDVVALAVGQFPPLPPSHVVANDPRVVVENYAGKSVFLTRQQDATLQDRIAFVLVSPSLAIFGNETAVRRALDRWKDGRLSRNLPPLMKHASQNEGAALAAGFDFSSVPPATLAASRIPLLPGLLQGAAVGNFKPPGLNVAATLRYDHPQTAQNAQGLLSNGQAWIGALAPWTALMGMPAPIQKLDARAKGADLLVVAALDPGGVTQIMSLMGGLLGWAPNPASPAPARAYP